jgi:glycosyltransferase involved in cell wall biosynthesis
MSSDLITDVIIPVLNEQNAVGLVIDEIPNQVVRNIYVVDNGSIDDTIAVAKSKGAIVCHEPVRGYGNACLKGIAALSASKMASPDVVVFLDGDYSDYPIHMVEMLKKLKHEDLDLVIGSRALGVQEGGSMTIPQLFGNWLSTFLLRLFYKANFTDLGPFRAIRYDALLQMDMQDKTYGWTVEMQLKAAKLKMEFSEIPVNYRNRIGVSKISGTVKGTILAGYKIIHTIFKFL